MPTPMSCRRPFSSRLGILACATAVVASVALVGVSCAEDSRGDSGSLDQVPTGPGPDSFRVGFETSRGNFTVQIQRAWAPLGADRFYTLVQQRFFDGARFFRVVPGFVVQFG